MADSGPLKVKLWREAWAAFKRNFHALLPWILVFAVFFMVSDFYTLGDEIQTMQDRMHAVKDQLENPSPAAVDPAEHAASQASSLARGFAFLVQFAAYYCFLVVYLRREPVAARPDFTMDNFLYWLGQVILAALVVLGLVMAISLSGALLGVIISLFIHGAVMPMVGIATVIAIGAALYAGIKFILVAPLAVSRIKPAVKTSWKMSDNNWWRLLWHYLMMVSVVWLALIAVFFIPAVVVFMVVPVDGHSPVFVGSLSVILGLSSAVLMAAGGVYFGTACRILHQEQGLPGTPESGSMTATI